MKCLWKEVKGLDFIELKVFAKINRSCILTI